MLEVAEADSACPIIPISAAVSNGIKVVSRMLSHEPTEFPKIFVSEKSHIIGRACLLKVA
ncbi:MAG TPA: hypothetical protein PLN19_08675 [Methanothrix sp.]|nr:hypothetical protein [Methanothrix sp.]